MTLQDCLTHTIVRLNAITAEAHLEASLLIAYVLAKPRAYLYAWPEELIDDEAQQKLDSLLLRRLKKEPIAYIIGYKDFWNFSLKVSPAVLIPRPETECLIEWILKQPRFSQDQQCKTADLGTGSGAIALALALERPHWSIVAIDQSEAALQVAKANAKELNINHIAFYQGDWCRALPENDYDLIVANPPYISQTEWETFGPHLSYEPQTALLSAQNGLADLNAICSQAQDYLAVDGTLLLEHGYDQHHAINALFKVHGFQVIDSVSDLLGHDRALAGWKLATNP